MPEGVEGYEGERTVHWRVQWKPKDGSPAVDPFRLRDVQRRNPKDAIELAQEQRSKGFDVKLTRVEETELDF